MASVTPDQPLTDGAVTVERVSRMFHDAPVSNIRKHLPQVVDALKEADLYDKPMVLMALSTIRAETAGFVPISEFKSRFNTSPNGHPFDLYDNRRDLGNRRKPDGASYKGRGFIQLTGRSNYKDIGKRIGLGNRLVDEPELANDAKIAAQILCAFLKRKEIAIKQLLLENDLRSARRLVNGGSHGLSQFTEAYRIGQREIPDIA
ncbi:MAG: peptidoglycan-binding protein [Pseudomonadota bacterium]|nr:peptidoglycan-binding protein [Pseudomonadota bacterium]